MDAIDEFDTLTSMPLPDGDFWVFGYGSLMWNPGFEYSEMQICKVYGYHRALCIWSLRYRGTETYPGLVLGLSNGGSCNGVAFKVTRNTHATARYLYEREMVSQAYQPRLVTIHLNNKNRTKALTFVSKRGHPQTVQHLSVIDQIEIVRKARGPKGSNSEYVENTVTHLDSIGIHDSGLKAIASALKDQT